MDKLRAELERMKRKKTMSESGTAVSQEDVSAKFHRRGDIGSKTSAALTEELPDKAVQAESKSSGALDETHAASSLGASSSLSSMPPDSSTTGPSGVSTGTYDTDNDEIYILKVKRLLRVFGEPITLFGETNAQRVERLKAIQLKRAEADERSVGQKNVMLDIKQQVEAELNELDDLNDNDNFENLDDEIRERKRQLKEQKAKEKSLKYKEDRPRESFESAAKFIMFAIKRWLYIWETDLAARDKSVAASLLGKDEASKHSEARHNVKPMIDDLKAGKLEKDILDKLERIIRLMQEREYLKAHQLYLEMSIGNAAWPMGVTNVGIHQRSADSKISDSNVAHIMNDERKRKYITSVLRLMTYCQQKYPTDPSKMFS